MVPLTWNELGCIWKFRTGKKIFHFFFFISAWEENCPVYGQSRFWEFSGLPDWKWFPGRALIETIFWTNNCKIIWSKIGENLFRKLILHFGGIKHPWSFKINLLNKFSLIFKVFKGQLISDHIILQFFFKLGLYQTSCPVRKSREFSKSGLSGNRTFFVPDAGLLTLLKIEKNTVENRKKIQKKYDLKLIDL